MRKLGVILGSMVSVLLLAMIAIPLVVDVDHYRPKITAAAAQQLNGSLELGKLRLSLWGHVQIEADGLKFRDEQGGEVIAVRDASFVLPFFSLLSGSPVIDLQMNAPVVNVIKNKESKLNLTSLMKGHEAAPQTAGGGTSQSAVQQPSSGAAQPGASIANGVKKAGTQPTAASLAVPAIVANARLGLQLLHAQLNYKDEKSGFTTQLKDFNFVAKNLSLTQSSEISVWSDFDTKMGQSMTTHGPGRMDLKFSPRIAGGKLEQFNLTGTANFDGLEISVPGSFEKKKGVASNLVIDLSGSEREVKINRLDFHFFNVDLTSSGSISNLDTTPSANYSLKSNEIQLSPWTELLPMLKAYELGGKASLSATVGGPAEKLSYQAKFLVSALTAKAPGLKTQPRFDGELAIATDQIQSLALSMKAPGNELEIKGKMLSFTAPQLSLDVSSSGMDLDQLIEFAAKPARSAQNGGWISDAYAEDGTAAAAAGAAAQDYDAMLEPLRTSKLMATMMANVGVNIKSLKAQGIRLSDLVGRIYLKDLNAGVDSLGFRLFGGSVKANASSNLRPKAPTYRFSMNVGGLDLGEAIKSQMAMFQNTLTGKANLEVSGEGASFNPEAAKSSLKVKGTMKVADAQFSSLDIGKMVVDGIKGSVGKIASKVPALSGKGINPPNVKSRYSMVSSDFGISGGQFTAPNVVGKAVTNQGFDLKGSVQVGLKDQSLNAKFEVIDTYNLSHAREFAGGLLAEKGKPFRLPVGAGCTLRQPCYSYGDAAEFLTKIAANNTVGAIKQQGLDTLKKALGGNGVSAPDVGKALKGLFGH